MLFLRFKAFIIDMFMIMMPIMYIATYIIFDSKEEFANSLNAPWITMFLYAFVIILFWYFKHQTPGMKAYDLVLLKDIKNEENKNINLAKIDKNSKTNNLANHITSINRVSFFDCVFRYFLFLFTFVFFILLLVSYFRKDKKTIYDIISKTYIFKQ
jgi:uncharacterized RDD family membrane protein YckC